MARIAGVIIPDKKRIVIALTYIFGVGKTVSEKALKEAAVDPNTKTSELKTETLNKLREIVEREHKIEGELRREVMEDVRRLKTIEAWRGMRHSKRLPARGQRTKTNSRTVRGNVRKTVGSGKRSAPGPT